ncbi:MAG TPA: NAD(+) kinase [Gammaproteobacteria bacterium]|nr:NAD(+) kinase [Gammaproteobacteria bacterium]
MQKSFQVIGLIGKYGDPGVTDTLTSLGTFLRDSGRHVLLDDDTSRTAPTQGMEIADRATLGRRCDLVVVVGGDGTLLSAVRSLADHGIPVVGINLGRLGFLADISPATMLHHMGEILSGQYVSEQRFLLHSEIARSGERRGEYTAFNDVVIQKWHTPRMIEFETHIDGRFVDMQRSDGMIICSPTGSTAYALSGGGPILSPGLNALSLVPICPHTLSNRPIVVDGDSEVSVVMRDCGDDHAQLTCDGQAVFNLSPGDQVRIRKKEKQIRLIHPRSYDYYQILRVKLGWGSKRG